MLFDDDFDPASKRCKCRCCKRMYDFDDYDEEFADTSLCPECFYSGNENQQESHKEEEE